MFCTYVMQEPARCITGNNRRYVSLAGRLATVSDKRILVIAGHCDAPSALLLLERSDILIKWTGLGAVTCSDASVRNRLHLALPVTSAKLLALSACLHAKFYSSVALLLVLAEFRASKPANTNSYVQAVCGGTCHRNRITR